MLSILHFIVASVLGGLISAKLVREVSALLVAGSAPLLGTVAIVFAANWGVSPFASLCGMALMVAGLCLVKSEPLRLLPLRRWQALVLAGLCFLVVAFTHHHNVNVLDSDRHLHDAQIVAFSRGVYPPVNPYFPDLVMNGHFGRDLLMSVLHNPGDDPVLVTWWVTPVVQLATFLVLFASAQVFTGSATRGLLISSMVFFGINCGFRVGLIDTFDGSNALAHPWLVLLMYLMIRVLERPFPTVWCVAGVV